MVARHSDVVLMDGIEVELRDQQQRTLTSRPRPGRSLIARTNA
jgi:hypothetical protein